MTDDSTPWATGLTVAAFVAAVTAAAIIVLSIGFDPRASAACGRAQPGGRRWAGADGVGMAQAAGVAVVRARCRRRRGGRVARAAGASQSADRRLPLAAGAHAQQHVLPRRHGRLALAGGAARAGVASGSSSSAGSAARARLGFGFGFGFGRRLAFRHLEVELGDRRQRDAAAGRSCGSISSQAPSSNARGGAAVRAGGEPEVRRMSDLPAFHANCTVQRPSSLRQASHVVASGSRPRATNAVVTVSSSVSTAGPSASTGCAAVASSAARERSSSTGWANRSTRATSHPAAAATCSTDAPARILA